MDKISCLVCSEEIDHFTYYSAIDEFYICIKENFQKRKFEKRVFKVIKMFFLFIGKSFDIRDKSCNQSEVVTLNFRVPYVR